MDYTILVKFHGIVAYCHATPWRDIFTTYETGYFGIVKMESTSVAKIVGIDNVKIVTMFALPVTC